MAKELTKQLFSKYQVLVKDLSHKVMDGQYIRIAVRNANDSNRLLSALQKELTA